MSLIYLVRHGETSWNRKEVFRGRKDIALSERGKKEAEAIAGALLKEEIDFIISSPLKRARETATPLARIKKLKLIVDEGLIDMDFGLWEGLTLQEVKARYPALYALWKNHPERVKFPEGESLKTVQKRAMSALERVTKTRKNNNGVVVTHRVVAKVILLSVLGAGLENFWRVKQDLGCINIIERQDSGWILHGLNYVDHLKALKDRFAKDF